MSDSSSNKYVKYIIIALVLAVAAHSLCIYTLQQIGEMKEKAYGLDKEIAVLNERLNYFLLIDKNTKAMENTNDPYGNISARNLTAQAANIEDLNVTG